MAIDTFKIGLVQYTVLLLYVPRERDSISLQPTVTHCRMKKKTNNGDRIYYISILIPRRRPAVPRHEDAGPQDVVGI